jgi:hypothetical protein
LCARGVSDTGSSLHAKRRDEAPRHSRAGRAVGSRLTAGGLRAYRGRAAAPTGFAGAVAQALARPPSIMGAINNLWRNQMPLLLWLLGVPLVVVILLRVFGMI